MKHEERMQIAEHLAKKIVEKYGDKILFIGVYGSVARNEDKEFSDVELVAVTTEKIDSKIFAYKDIAVLIHFITREEALKALGDVFDSWWFGWVGTLLYAKRLYGSEELLDEFRTRVNSIPDEDYRKAAANTLAWMLEFLNQIKNALKDNDLYSATTSSLYYRTAAGEFVAYLNKKHYKSHVFRSLREAEGFQRLPKDYFKLMTRLGTSCDLKAIHSNAVELWENCLSVAKASNIKMEAYTSLEETRLENQT